MIKNCNLLSLSSKHESFLDSSAGNVMYRNNYYVLPLLEVKQMNIGHGFRFEHRGSLNLLGQLPTIKNHTVPPSSIFRLGKFAMQKFSTKTIP